jgi:pimeloyl-ACP methyl ester carboxylesterase
MRRPVLVAALLLGVAVSAASFAPGLTASAAAQAPAFSPCPGQRSFNCATLPVPLDAAGRIPGTIPLHVAVQAQGGSAGVLVALTGGPGQSGIMAGPLFERSLAPALARYRIAVLDQRGTGRSNVLRCPELQAMTTLTIAFPEDYAGCGRRLDGRRDFFSTVDSVDDIEALRRALGVERIALMGVSYGTFVATQYARRYPQHTERLILDSVVAPGGVDQFELESFRALPRVVREQCALNACRGITADPLADLTALVGALRTQPLRGLVFDKSGGRRPVRLSVVDMIGILFAGDLNPVLRARIPSAVVSAVRGDGVPLLRLRRDASGEPTKLRELSAGLFAATICADTRLAYSLQTPFDQRAALLEQALAAVSPQEVAPFDRAEIRVQSAAELCLQWPVGNPRAPETAPLPDVPALILDGREDLRTPLENGAALAAQMPRAQVATVAGTGHDVLDSDLSGCATLALTRFMADEPVGDACAGGTSALPLAPIAPLTLDAVSALPGVHGVAGRAVHAALDTITDVRMSIVETLLAGIRNPGGGGLRGGRYTAAPAPGLGALIALHDVAYVPGVRLTGQLRSILGLVDGEVTISGPGGLRGRLRFDPRHGVSGRVAGRRVRLRPRQLKHVRQASPSALAARLPQSLPR